MNNQPPTIGETLKYLRNQHGYKQDYVALRLGITRSAYSHYENNQRIPDLGILLSLSDFYKIPPELLIHMICES